MSETRWTLGIFNFQTMGRGKAKMMMSVMMLPPALMYHRGRFGMHLAGMLAFQKASTGMQPKMEVKTSAMLHAQMPTMMTIMSTLDLTATKG